jgi:hypothetical protein
LILEERVVNTELTEESQRWVSQEEEISEEELGWINLALLCLNVLR